MMTLVPDFVMLTVVEEDNRLVMMTLVDEDAKLCYDDC